MRCCVYIGTLSPPPLSISCPFTSPSICFSTAAAVMALLLGFGLVTLPEMLLQPSASVKQSPQHFSGRLPNALSKCSPPQQKLNIQGPQTITILSPFVFFSSVNTNLYFCSLPLLYSRYKNCGSNAATLSLGEHYLFVFIEEVTCISFPVRYLSVCHDVFTVLLLRFHLFFIHTTDVARNYLHILCFL